MQLEDEQSAGVSRPLDKDLARRRKRRAALFAPPRETAGDRPIDMSRIDLCLSFGKHHSVDDAAELAEEMRRVAPHVYVQETVDMPEAERLARIVRTNLENARARKERGFRDALLAAHQGEAWERDYSREERRIVIDSKRVVFYTVEGYSPSEIADWRRALALTQDAAPLEACLARGDIEGALRHERENLECFAKVGIGAKNARIVEGFERMRGELLRVAPQLAGSTALTLLARYGRAHEGLWSSLREKGFRVSVRGAESPAVFSDAVLIRMSAGERVSDEAVAAALFQGLHSTVFPLDVTRRYSEWSANLHRRFERLGRTPALFTLPRAAAGSSGDLRALAARVATVLRALD